MTQCILCRPDDDGVTHPTEPGWQTCFAGYRRMAAALRDIPVLVDELAGLGYVERDARPKLDQEGRTALAVGDGGRVVGLRADPVAYALPSGPVNGARSGPRVMSSGERSLPIRIDPTDLLLPARPASLAIADTGAYASDQVGHLAVATELEFWARDWADARRERCPLPTVPVLAGWLLDRLDWACGHHPALGEFAEKLRSLRSTLTAAAGRYEPRPEVLEVPCPGCHQLALYRDADLERIACGGCPVLLTEESYADHVKDLIREVS